MKIKSKKFTKKEIKSLVDVVVSDLKHQVPERQEVNDKNIKRDLFFIVIRAMFDKEKFFHEEKENDGTVRVGLYIKGYVREVWDYLMDAYDTIHDDTYMKKKRSSVSEVVKLMKKMSDEKRMEVMANFCKHCGTDNPNCQCWNDD